MIEKSVCLGFCLKIRNKMKIRIDGFVEKKDNKWQVNIEIYTDDKLLHSEKTEIEREDLADAYLESCMKARQEVINAFIAKIETVLSG